jgi:uncharacterized protein
MRRKPANPVLWLVIALPLLAVAASFASLTLAITRGDQELPKNYHWEGGAFDRDQQQLALAARRQISATLAVDVTLQRCTVRLQGAAPATLQLQLTHPTAMSADRRIILRRSGDVYLAPCTALPDAHWWLELADDADQWLLRARARGTLQQPVTLGADGSRMPAAP